jgi:predicted porin
MKKIITIIGMSALAAGAQAQSPASGTAVTLYGTIDTSVEHLTNAGPSGGGLTRMPSLTGSIPSRWGMRGSEDLGGGLRAVFTLESGFAPDSGTQNQGGRAFGRQAMVGLSGGWGTLSFGRQNTMLFWALTDGEVFGPNAYGLASHDNYVPNARADNSVSWLGKFGGFTAGATYSLGRDAVNAGPSPSGTNCPGESATDTKMCREWSALLKYDAPVWGVAAAIDEIRGGPGAFGGLVRSDLKDTRVVLNGYYKFGAVKLAAGVIQRDNEAAAPLSATNGQSAKSNLYWLGASYPVTPILVLDGQVQRLNFKDGGDRSTLGIVRGTYFLSKRTGVYAQAARISNGARLAISASSAQPGGGPVAGGSQTGLMLGVRHAF